MSEDGKEQTRLEHIRAQADSLGVKYHHRAGVAKIQEAIEEFLATQGEADHPSVDLPVPNQKKNGTPQNITPMSEEEFRQSRLKEQRRDCARLIRVRIQCMNPSKKDWPGEIISVGSAKLGTFKKYVPYNGEPWHIPKIIYEAMLEKKCSVFYNAVGNKGHKTRKSRLIPEYNIAVLAPLTPLELRELARKQAMAAGQENAG